jgi:multicomponent Na+:H+ antiporter subunit A
VVLSGARPVPATTSAEFVRLAPEGAGAYNVISAIIVDFRALDTVGEITVLFTAAMGVASLILDRPYERLRRRRDGGGVQQGEEPSGADDVALHPPADEEVDGVAADGGKADSGVWRPAPVAAEGEATR